MDGESRVIRVTIDRGIGREDRPATYEVPVEEGESVLGVHSSCRIGLCTGCLVRVNGKACFACTTLAEGDMLIEPCNRETRLRDLVVHRGVNREIKGTEGEA